jgi:hypothetical protein
MVQVEWWIGKTFQAVSREVVDSTGHSHSSVHGSPSNNECISLLHDTVASEVNRPDEVTLGLNSFFAGIEQIMYCWDKCPSSW